MANPQNEENKALDEKAGEEQKPSGQPGFQEKGSTPGEARPWEPEFTIAESPPKQEQPVVPPPAASPEPKPEKPQKPGMKPPAEKAAGKPPAQGMPVWLRRTLRWSLLILIFFFLGALAVTFLFYLPQREEVNQHSADLQAAQQQITDLQQQVSNLQSFQEKNQQLQSQTSQSDLHVALLKAQLDVANARIALLNKKPADAQIALSTTPETLQKVAGFLAPNQRDAATSMQQRLTQVLSEINKDDYAAQSDLDVLATKLLQMENSLFTQR